MPTPSIQYHAVDSSFVRSCFAEAVARFPLLAPHGLHLEQLPLAHYTMRAQPVFNRFFWQRKKRHFRVQMSNHLQMAQYIQIEELPREVLVGWFAHELGHIMDYRSRSVLSLVWFVIGYLLFPTHRIGAERKADLFAIEQGFGSHLLATKTYILEHSNLPNAYKNRIQKYYLSPTELEEILQYKEA